MKKSFFRCTVCNDVHYGIAGPKVCPTCKAENVYVSIEEKEARMIIFREKKENPQISQEELREVWEGWAKDKDFILNPDKEHTKTAIGGVLEQEQKTGIKYCPCRLQKGDFEKDLHLICPCNFRIQKTWKEKDMCWCGLFVKREKLG
jgi:ferredoxin-thioredoxin reductase catalytic subunit